MSKKVQQSKRDLDLNLLNKIKKALFDGAIEKDDLMSNNRLSLRRLNDLGFSTGLGSLQSDPELYPVFREIKLSVEGYGELLSFKEIKLKYADLISRVAAVMENGGNTTDLSSINSKLYEEAKEKPHWPLIRYLSVPESDKKGYWYWTDEDLITEAGNYKNLTNLKLADNTLHKHIKGRSLELALFCKWPHYNTDSYIGLNHHVYRSQGELVFGNMICLAGLEGDWRWQVHTGLYRQGSNKPMTADFQCITKEVLVEISMFEEKERGSRGVYYVNRRDEKAYIYEKYGKQAIFIDSSPFYRNGCIDAESFAQACIMNLAKYGYDGFSNAQFTAQKLLYNSAIDVKRHMTAKDFLDYLEGEHGLTRMAQLSNDKSYLNKYIKMREDSEEVFGLLREKGKRTKSRKISETVKNKNNASIASLKKCLSLT